MSRAFELLTETAVPEKTEAMLGVAVDLVLSELQVTHSGLSILLTDDAAIRSLNRQFRGFDEATDVLSFPAGDEPEVLFDGAGYLGDIAISVPFAARQASARGHSTLEELQLLVIHGMLHLLGYDHEKQEDRDTMWHLQRSLLDTLGLQHVVPTEEAHE